ncbi:family 16 glycosylhydrolase [Photobacterium rosenbergii]|uniref:family 16 glycosylhydrolase n=1 Tax=Photobacterium rosenbergii TaxID=294936 RepID=UPI001C99A917|nr:family 16 glycosylhydrolase [Photobacterium rosenbergii]MBY5944018.1 family 16 glycosylhydrolase [Photobacterium rosenbergii]
MLLRTLSQVTGFIVMITFSPFINAKATLEDPLTELDSTFWWKSHGWSNGFPSYTRWESEAISHSDEGMAITLSYAPNEIDEFDFQSGELRSEEFYGYGCYEVEMKPIAEPGVVSSFFLFAGPFDKPKGGNGMHNEIDIEFLGYDTNMLQINFWTNDDRYAQSHEQLVYLDFDASQDFHRYAIKWTKNSIQWFVDGSLVFTVKNSKRDPIPSARDSQLRIMMNVWATDERISNWAGEFSKDPETNLTAYYRNFRYLPLRSCSL